MANISCRSFPLLYFNMGGEMMYIIEQRLEAQNIDRQKSQKVINDILSTLLNRKFIKSLLQFGMSVPAISSLKSLFEKIAHVSIMKLAAESMDKLFDLMVMVFKYQLIQIPSPDCLVSVTLNHMDSWKNMTSDPEILLQINHTRSLIIQAFSQESLWSMQKIRWYLLNHFSGWKIRVSVLLKNTKQNENGYFRVDLEQPWNKNTNSNFDDSFKKTTLGENVYRNVESSNATKTISRNEKFLLKNLLGDLMDDVSDNNQDDDIDLCLQLENLVDIQSNDTNEEVVEVPVEFQDNDDEVDLLDLLDEAVKL